MATKKQKRAAALAKHEAFMESVRQSGLEAQRKVREYRERKRLEAEMERDDRREKQRKSTLDALREMRRETATQAALEGLAEVG